MRDRGASEIESASSPALCAGHAHRAVVLAVVAFLAGGCAGAQHDTGGAPFAVTIHDYHGAMAYSLDFRVRPDLLTVTFLGDLEGEAPEEVYRRELSAEEADHWRQALERLPLDVLRSEYIDPDVCDGLQLTFEIELTGRPARKVKVANTYQPDLAVLVELLDDQLPPRYRIGFGPEHVSSRNARGAPRSGASDAANVEALPETADVNAFLREYIERRMQWFLQRSTTLTEHDLARECILLASELETFETTKLHVRPARAAADAVALLRFAADAYARAMVAEDPDTESLGHWRRWMERVIDEVETAPTAPPDTPGRSRGASSSR